MQSSFLKRCWSRIAIVGAVLLLSGCASTSISTTPEQSVAIRANQRWQALINADLEKAYQMMPPSYRAVTTLAAYRATFGAAVQWKAAEATKVTCETEKCVALIKIEAKPIAGRNNLPLVTYFEEIWIREASQWWFFPA